MHIDPRKTRALTTAIIAIMWRPAFACYGRVLPARDASVLRQLPELVDSHWSSAERLVQVMAACSADDTLACRLLRPDLFLAMSRDAAGTVALQDLADSLHTGSHRAALWEQAAHFDTDGDGQLSQGDVERLIVSMAGASRCLPMTVPLHGA